MKHLAKWIGAIVLIMACVALCSGCSNEQLVAAQAQAAQAKATLTEAQTQMHDLVGKRALLDQALAELEANSPTDPAAKAEWDAKVAQIKGQLQAVSPQIEKVTKLVDEYTSKLQGLLDQISNAQTGEEALGATISSTSSAVGMATGQVLITLLGGLLGRGIGLIGERKRQAAAKASGIAEGAGAVATGIEAHRNDALEQQHPGFLVVEKAGVAITHAASGVSGAIDDATKLRVLP